MYLLLIKRTGKAPILLVDSQSLIIAGMKGKLPNFEPLRVQEKETSRVRRAKFKPHDEGMQVSQCVDTEVS